MAKSLFSKDVQPCCACCLNGRQPGYGENILCKRFGIVNPGFSCKKFRYDPLKRVPVRPPALPSFSKDDFDIG